MILNRRQLLILWVGLGLFVAAFVWDALFSGERNLARYKNSIEGALHNSEKAVEKTLADKEFIDRRLQSTMSGIGFDKDLVKLDYLRKEPFNFCISKDDSLIFWTQNDILPLWSDFLDTVREKTHVNFVTLKGSQFELRYRHTRDDKGAKITTAALIPIKKKYSTFEGQYLESHFEASSFIPVALNLVESKQKYGINTFDQHSLCYLSDEDADGDLTHDLGTAILLFGGFFLICIFGDRIARQMLRQYKTPIVGTIFFFGCMALTRLSVLWIQHSNLLPLMDLTFGDFNNAIFVKSLTELVIDTAFLFWIAVFFNGEFRLPDFKGQPIWKQCFLAASFYCVIVLLLIMCIGIFNDLVTNWNNLLAFDNLSDFKIKSVFALLGVGIILFSVFLISHRIILSVNELGINNWQHFLALDVAVGVGVLSSEIYNLNLPTWMFVLFIFVYVGLFHQFIRYKRPGLIWLVQWIVVFAAIQSFFISRFNVQKDKKILEDYAYSLSNERDVVAERRVKILTDKIEKDNIIQTLSIFPIRLEIDPKRVAERINLHFDSDEYLSNQYSFRFFSFYRNNEALIQADSFDLHSMMKLYEMGQGLDKKSRFWSDKKGDFAYLSIAEVPVMPNNPIYVAMEFKRQDKLSSRVFTELFVDKHYKSLPRLNDYSYAIFKNSICTEQNQTGVYDKYINNADLPELGTYKHYVDGFRDELIYRNTEGVVVRIGKERAVSSQGFTLWMYIVLMLALLLFILSVSNHFIDFLPEIAQFTLSFSFNSSFRNRILFPSIAFILLSYAAIFYFTVRYFKNIDEKYYNTDLESKSNTIVTNVINELNELHTFGVSNPKTINQLLARYSESHQNAMHFFDTEGYLYATTESNIFDKGIISKRMNPAAFFHLKSLKDKIYKSDENIGKFHYKSSYYAIQDSTNALLGFLELPYYSRDRKMRVGVSDIWSYNATILTLLFIFGICVIYIRTSKNMKPIQHIADRLNKLRLGNKVKNEPIQWDRKDEIGVLIDAYNNKVSELEDTYSRLSEAEREGAWRDMAKQVAHEIRNPLTPMKLIVQHLEMIRRQRPENLEEYLIRSNKVLLDQIDNLEKIVSEFANFAKMPQKANNEPFVINDLVNSVGDLFSQKEDGKEIVFSLNVSEERYTVYADRTLLTGALNNLVKNAIQAIPENREGRVSVSLYRRGAVAVIRISDNGTGIPKDIQDKIFTPNFTTKQYGNGIGLLITKNIIQSVNGRITFETADNEGTDFFVELDIQEIEQPEGVSENITTFLS